MIDYLIVILGATVAIGIESIYRSHHGTFDQIFILTWLLSILTTYGVFKAQRISPDLLTGMVLWSTTTIIMRLLATLIILKERPSPGSWMAFGLIILASAFCQL